MNSLWSRTFRCRSFYSQAGNTLRVLQRKSPWLLVGALAGGAYSYYVLHHKLHTTPVLGLRVQQNDDEFRVGGKGGDDRSLKKDSEIWMAQQGQISPKRRAMVLSLGVGGVAYQSCDAKVMHTFTGFLLAVVLTRYRRCPSNKVLVVYGRGLGLQAGPISKTLHGGGTLVLPILQDYRYLSLEPMQVHG